MEMNDSVWADALVGAGVVGDNAAATSLGTVPEEGELSNNLNTNIWICNMLDLGECKPWKAGLLLICKLLLAICRTS